MAKEQNPKINSILKNIVDLDKKNFALLYASGNSIQPYPNYTSSEIETLINDTKRVLNDLSVSVEILQSLYGVYLTNLDNQLNAFITQFNSIATLSVNQLSNQHHSCLNQLQSLNNTLRQSGIYSILTPSNNIPKLTEELNDLKIDADKLVKEAKGNANLIRNLIPEATATSLSVALDEIAKKIRIRVNIWLTVVIVVLIFSAIFSWLFLDSNDKKENNSLANKQTTNNVQDIIKLKSKSDSIAFIIASTANLKKQTENNPETTHDTNSFVYWLKRIIVFLPLFYLIVFCIKQYNKERKLLEIYVHKKAIAQTLPAYMEQAEKDETLDEILLRGSTMIFTLPENPESPIQGSDGIGLEEIKSILDIKDKLTK